MNHIDAWVGSGRLGKWDTRGEWLSPEEHRALGRPPQMERWEQRTERLRSSHLRAGHRRQEHRGHRFWTLSAIRHQRLFPGRGKDIGMAKKRGGELGVDWEEGGAVRGGGEPCP